MEGSQMESKFYSIDHKVEALRELRMRAHAAVIADFARLSGEG